MNALMFRQLREANLKRLPRFKDRLGHYAHTQPDGSDWKPERWSNAMLGEVGELAGELKKAARGDYGSDAKYAIDHDPKSMPKEVLDKIRYEMADVVTYLDLLAVQFGVDLGQAVMDKFNIVSERVEAGVGLMERMESFQRYDGEIVVMDDDEIPI